MISAVAEGLAAAQSIKPGHGNVIAALAARPDWLGGQLGYQHHVNEHVSLFANAVAGARSTSAGWVPDVGALGGIKFVW